MTGRSAVGERYTPRLVWLGVMGLLVLVACRPPAALAPVRLKGDRLQLAWSFSTGGPLNEPPLRVGEIVVTLPQGGPLWALNVRTGEPAWQYDPPQGLWDRSLAVDAERVFVALRGGRLVALSARDGRLLWERELGIDVQAPLLVAQDVIYAASTFVGPDLANDTQGRALLFALDAADGQLRWEFVSESYILQTPTLYGDRLYTGGSYADETVQVDEGGPMRIYALQAGDGALLWTYQSQDGYVKALFANATAVAYIAYTDFTHGLSATRGEHLWRKDTGNWVPSLAGYDGVVYYGSANTVVHAVQIENGETLWEYNIPGGSFNYVLGKPVWVSDELVFLSQQGDILALQAASGELSWQISTGRPSRAGLSIFGNTLFTSDMEGVIYAYLQE